VEPAESVKQAKWELVRFQSVV